MTHPIRCIDCGTSDLTERYGAGLATGGQRLFRCAACDARNEELAAGGATRPKTRVVLGCTSCPFADEDRPACLHPEIDARRRTIALSGAPRGMDACPKCQERTTQNEDKCSTCGEALEAGPPTSLASMDDKFSPDWCPLVQRDLLVKRADRFARGAPGVVAELALRDVTHSERRYAFNPPDEQGRRGLRGFAAYILTLACTHQKLALVTGDETEPPRRVPCRVCGDALRLLGAEGRAASTSTATGRG